MPTGRRSRKSLACRSAPSPAVATATWGSSSPDTAASVQRVAGKRIEIREEPRREGDPPSLVAGSERIRQLLGWEPKLDDLDGIVRTALRWEEQLQRSPW